MSEYLGEQAFLQEAHSPEETRFSKGDDSRGYALPFDRSGISLQPVWSCVDGVVEFLMDERLAGSMCAPYAIDLDVFGKRELTEETGAIDQLLINVAARSPRALVLTLEESTPEES